MHSDPTYLAAFDRLYPKVAAKIGGRPEVLFAVEKPPQRHGLVEKHVLVGMYDHQHRRSLLAVMDMERQTVVDVHPAGVQFQLSEKERREAERIASQDKRVREVLAGRPMDPLTRLYLPKGGSGNRHAIVFLRPSSSERWFAIVDLTSGSTVQVISRRQLAGQ